MQVIFIHHSCFLVEVDDLVLIFDYFGGDRVKISRTIWTLLRALSGVSLL